MSYLIQGLRPDIQADVLKKEPKTYADAEDSARLIYSIHQSLFQRREEDISRLVQNAKTTPTPEDTRLKRLEQNMQKLLSCLEKQPQDPGGGYFLQWPIRGGSAGKGYLFQASGI